MYIASPGWWLFEVNPQLILSNCGLIFILFCFSGLLHISNITRGRIASVSNLLEIDEKVKVLVVKSMFPDKISLR